MAGLYFEEFAVGQTIEHAIRRTVTEADNTLFSVMTMNPQPLHLDAFELEFPVGARKPILLVAHPGEEILFLLSGRIEFQVAADRFTMDAGDCLHFNAAQPHMGRNVGNRPARMLMVVSPSRAPARHFGWWTMPATMAAAGDRKPSANRAATSPRRRASTGERR